MTALADLREGLHVSVSQLKCYLKCPEKYRLQYVVGAEPEFRPANLVLGSAVHEGLAAYYRVIKETGESADLDVAMAAFRATLAASKGHPIPLEETDDDLEAVGTGLLTAFHESIYQDPPVVVAVELPFVIELHDPSTGELLEEALVGALDLVVEENGRKVIGEHKTTAKKWSKAQIRYDLQLSGYKLVGQKLEMGDVGLRLQMLTKTKTPTFLVENVERTEKDIGDFLTTAVGVLRAVDVGAFFPVRTSMCAGCPFRRRCEGT